MTAVALPCYWCSERGEQNSQKPHIAWTVELNPPRLAGLQMPVSALLRVTASSRDPVKRHWQSPPSVTSFLKSSTIRRVASGVITSSGPSLPPSSAQDPWVPAPESCVGRRPWLESEREGPLERHQAQTCFAWHDPQWVVPASQLPAWPCQGPHRVLQAKPLHERVGLPRLVHVASDRPVPGGGDMRVLLLASSSAQRGWKVSVSWRLSQNTSHSLKHPPPSAWP